MVTPREFKTGVRDRISLWWANEAERQEEVFRSHVVAEEEMEQVLRERGMAQRCDHARGARTEDGRGLRWGRGCSKRQGQV